MDPLPLFGREDELASLQSAFAAAMGGAGRVVSIVGPRGIGKTRLVEELREHAREPGILWAEGRCTSFADGTAYGPFRDMIQRAAGIGPLDPEDEQREKVGRFVERLAPDRVQAMLPPLCALLSLAHPGAELETRGGQARVLWLHDALEELMGLWTAGGPTVLVLDDLHWCDGRSEEVIDHILARIAGRRALVVCCYVPDYAPESRHVAACRIQMGPLSDEAAAALLACLLPSGRITAPVRATLLARARGNPFYIVAVARALCAAPVGEPGSDGLVPRSVSQAILSHLRALEVQYPRAADVLRCAALIGGHFPAALVGCALGRDARLLHEDLDLLVSEGILAPAGPSSYWGGVYAFTHEMVQAQAMVLLPEEERAPIHNRIAVAMVELFPAHRSQYPGRLAHHFDHAGQPHEAVRWYHVAALQQVQDAAFAAVPNTCNRALSLLEEMDTDADERRIAAELCIAAAAAATFVGQTDEALAMAERGLEGAMELRNMRLEATAHEKIGLTYERGGKLEPARQHYREAERLFQKAGDPFRATVCRNGVLTVLFDAGHYERARMEYEAELARIRAREHRDNACLRDEVSILNNLGAAAVKLGRYDEALERFKEAQDIIPESEDALGLAHIVANTAEALYCMGDARRALAQFEEALRRFRSMGSRLMEGFILKDVARCHLELAQYDQARLLAWESYCVGQEVHSELCQTGALAVEAAALMYLGDFDDALRAAEQAVARAVATDSPEDDVEAAIALAEVHLARGQPTAALAPLRSAATHCQVSRNRLGEARALTVYSEACRRVGQSDPAVSAAQEALEAVERTGARAAVAGARLAMGAILADRSEWSQAAALQRSALDAAVEMGHPRPTYLAAVGLARCERELGHGNEALGLLDQAVAAAEKAMAGCGPSATRSLPARDLESIRAEGDRDAP